MVAALLLTMGPAFASLASHAPAQASGDDPEAVMPHPQDLAIWGLLREMRVKPLPPLAEQAPRLAPLARQRLDTVFTILEERSVPGFAEISAQALSLPQEDLIIEALRMMSATTVLGEAARRVDLAPSARTRANAVRIAGAVGSADELWWMFELVGKQKEVIGSKAIQRAVESGVTDLLTRNPAAFGQLLAVQREVPSELMPALLRAIGATEDARGLTVLGEVISWRSEFAGHAISQVPRLGASDWPETNERLSDRIRPFLNPDDPELCQSAALALGELGDLRCVSALIDLLEEDAPGLRRNAGWALRRLTGLAFPDIQTTWSTWFQEELKWARRDKARVLDRLESLDDTEVIAAIQDASYHPLFRHELSEALCAVLGHPRPRLRILACRTLERLSSPVAVLPLVDRLEDRDEEVRAAALLALRHITGRELPGSTPAWRAALAE